MKKKYKGYLIARNLNKSYSIDIYMSLFPSIDYSIKNIRNEDELMIFLDYSKFDFVNITIPYKSTVIPFLDRQSETVKQTHACNLIIKKNGLLIGYNTDAYGFISSLHQNDIDVKDKNVLILGNGATSSSVKYALDKLQAKSIVKACRTIKKEGEVLFNDCPKDNINIIVNTTPVGKKHNDILIDISQFKDLEVFVDCIYDPYRTTHMIAAKNLGKGAVGGLDMLIAQAILNYSFVTGSFVPNVIRKSIKTNILLEQVNLILVGLPTSGKTSACKELKKLLNKKQSSAFFDTDEMIEKTLKMPVSEIFKNYGEEEFRKMETMICKTLSHFKGTIISTGGGLIINEENYNLLSKNGFFVYLKKTNFDDFVPNKKRPLVKCKGDLLRLYRERNPIYEKVADLTISSNSTAQEIIEEACNAIVNS